MLFLLGRYDDGSNPRLAYTKAGKKEIKHSLDAYPLGIDVFMMLLGGFGYLMTFLKRYGLGALGITMIITAILTELAIIVMGLTKIDSEFVIKIGFVDIMEGGVVAAAVLITYGVLLGKVMDQKNRSNMHMSINISVQYRFIISLITVASKKITNSDFPLHHNL